MSSGIVLSSVMYYAVKNRLRTLIQNNTALKCGHPTCRVIIYFICFSLIINMTSIASFSSKYCYTHRFLSMWI